MIIQEKNYPFCITVSGRYKLHAEKGKPELNVLLSLQYFVPNLFSAPCNSGDVRLYGTSVERAGVVHVCVNGTWGKVCGGDNSPQFASVICSQLGYSPFGKTFIDITLFQYYCNTLNLIGAVADRSIWSDNYFVFTMYHPLCVGNESKILDCSFSTHDTVPSSCSQRSVLTSYRYYYYSNYDVTSILCLPGDTTYNCI